MDDAGIEQAAILLTILVGLSLLFLLPPYLEAPLRSALERSLTLWIRWPHRGPEALKFPATAMRCEWPSLR